MSGAHRNIVIHSRISNPRLNLALEDVLFRRLEGGGRTLFIYRNGPAVVIGRFQNPWLECDVELLARDGIPLIRRRSGGGTVFHDPGNTNVSFMASAGVYDQDENFALLLDGLERAGINAEKNSRNDLVLGGKKISGSAFKKTSSRSLHHCTLLIDADLRSLKKYLRPEITDLSAKGTRSVKSEVVNCGDIAPGTGHAEMSEALEKAFIAAYGIPDEIRLVDERTALKDGEIRSNMEELESWEWTFGKTPPFDQFIVFRHPELDVSAKLRVRHCIVEEVSELEVSPAAFQKGLSAVCGALTGIPYRRRHISNAAAAVTGEASPRESAPSAAVSDFIAWLPRQILYS